MSNSLSDFFAAATAGPAFTLEDCHDLDLIVRSRGNDSVDLSPLSEAAVYKLCLKLNSIASGFSAQRAVGPVRPPTSQVDKLSTIRKGATDLLTELGLNVHSRPNEISFEHFVPGGIFEDPDIKFEPLIQALQAIALHAEEALTKLKENGVEKQRRSPDPILYRLYDDLGGLYKDMWGSGSVPVSVNGGKGGPAVRYFDFTLHRILGRTVKHQAIKDAVEKIKSGGVDLSDVYSVYSPHGGRRI